MIIKRSSPKASITKTDHQGTRQDGAGPKKIKGIYVLSISVRKDNFTRVGALGTIKFTEGTYAYVGSAQNGVKERVARHLKKEKKRFWHIDYLLAQKGNSVEEVFYQKAPREKECRIAEALSELGKPIRGFGCSDCFCASHLFRMKKSTQGVLWNRGMGRLEKLKVTIDGSG